ncbi:MAG: adenylate kinase [Kiritimatiellae bacterium]|nr:adenylate kinase [Kiritimatiellia bacterium]
MKIVILLGAPGSGKGTVAARLASENANLKHVSSGDLLRGAVAKGTEAGQKAKAFMEAGQLVPDELIAQMIKDVIAETEGDVTMLLDGFPRNVKQADILADTGAEIRSAVLLDVPDSIIQDRIAGRRTCPKCKAGYHAKDLPPKVEGICDHCGTALVIRKDDNPETVKDRLVVYHQQTEPLIAYYKEKGLLRVIDGNQGPANNAKAFLAAM